MAERIEEPETEVDASGDPVSAAAALAIGMRRGRSRERPDPGFDAFLSDQRRLINLQTEHLHEQREVILSRLKLGRWKDRVSLALQTMTVFIGLAVAAAVALMAWQAHQDHGVVIEAFAVPPDLAQRGMTGQVVAREVLDRLSEMQAQTVTGRPAYTYANGWGEDIKVEIPETGVSIGELNRWLRQWLGSETRISGEVVRTASGLAVAARAGASTRFDGPEADLDRLVGQAAEGLYAQTQPYRYAVYLASRGRQDEALAAYARLARSGSPEDQAWAYAGWATSLFAKSRSLAGGGGDGFPLMSEAVRLADTAIRLNPRLYAAYPILGNGLWLLGRQEASVAVIHREIPMHERGDQFIGLSKPEAVRRLILLRGVEGFETGDYQSAATQLRSAAGVVDFEGQADAYNSLSVMAQALALDHDVTASRQSPRAASAAFEQAFALDDWASQTWRAQKGQNRNVRNLAAIDAHLGRLAEAEALLANMAMDCNPCLRLRGLVAALKHDWPAANRWYAEAARQEPSLPFAYAEWGQALLANGDLDPAIAKLTEAHRRSPHFSDPLELWGEALMKKGDYAGAVAKFAEADKYAPRWGRNHMRWGEGLMLAGRHREARAQYEAANGMDLSKPDHAALNVLLARTASGPLHG